MPRDGSGASDSLGGEDPGHNIVHGAGDSDGKASSGVDRSSKAAPLPDFEKGDALEGMGASGGGDSATGSGQGPKETSVEQEAKKQ